MSEKTRNRKRCFWAPSELMIEYHDREWDVPLHDDRKLFEFLILEGAQAGLSWETILKKGRRIGKRLIGLIRRRRRNMT
ncbi:MAG TPA: DNA-3-methyladenine glycosylase I [Tepidisphaeraceae bacterium]|jgi:3-methyladenine DNA glycosylase Tag|nr:DNA-3-methyladenine glycosylase I [Tepidisphaeraceae bacterium]